MPPKKAFMLHNATFQRMNQQLFLVILALLWQLPSTAQMAIEDWRDHFHYPDGVAVTTDNTHVYHANANMIFSLRLDDNSIERLSKVNALSDVGISAVAYDMQSSTLIVGYENGNLDLIRKGRTTNISSILTSSIFGFKGINHILPVGGRAYLSCGFGIVLIDLENNEVVDTYIIGPGATNLEVYATAILGDRIVAATLLGLYEADANSSFLANFVNWSPVTTIPGVPGPKEIEGAEAVGEYLVVYVPFAETDDKVYATTDMETWLEVWSESELRGINVSNNHLVIRTPTGVHAFQQNLNQVLSLGSAPGLSWISTTGAAITAGNNIWLPEIRGGLVHHNWGTNQTELVNPSAPERPDAYRLLFQNGKLYKSAGGPSSNWNRTFNNSGLEVLSEGKWMRYAPGTVQEFDDNSVRDFMVAVPHPDDDEHWFIGTWGYGLYELKNGSVVNHYTSENSPLAGSAETLGPGVAGLAFDSDKNLWVTNGYSNTPLLALTPEGEWFEYSHIAAGGSGSNLVSDIVITSSNHKWMVRPRGNGILVYNDNGNLDDIESHQARALNSQAGSGNLPTNDVYAIAEDLNGEIWVGTGEGIAVFFAPSAVFSETSNFDAQQILLEQDGNIQILLETEVVTAIAVDGANQKWLGTAGAGAFLMSPDGTREIYRFNTTNSPLPSNSIRTITIDGETGEVYFGTDMGVVSFRGTATDGRARNECAKVFPNPVRADYFGPVAITGLERNTNVKITDLAGNLVFETTSEGGQAIWDANNFRGERVTTGVYTALCVAPENQSSCVAKIMVVK